MAVDYRVKLILCGDTYVGKSSLMTRFSNSSKFNELKTTIGVDYSTRDVTFTHARTHAPIVVAAQVWDTAGQERFRAIASAYYRGTDGALMVFDVTDDGSFKRLDTWVDDLRRFDLWRRGVPIVLVGNKIDLLETHERRVPRETALEYARANGLSYVETSALTNDHVDDAFIALLTNIMRRLDVTSVAPCDPLESSSSSPPRVTFDGVKIDASPPPVQPRRVRSNSRSSGHAIAVASSSSSSSTDRIVLKASSGGGGGGGGITSPRWRRRRRDATTPPPPPPENSSCC